MAITIPSAYKMVDATAFEVDTGDIYDQTDDGATRIREIYSATRYVINAVYGPLSISECSALVSFFIVNRSLEFTITVDGEVYTCAAVSPPLQGNIGVSRSVSVSFRGVKNA